MIRRTEEHMSGQRRFKTEVGELREQLVAWRRDFHQHPELGFEEHRSAGRIEDHLRGLGYQVQTGVGRTGVVGLLEGAGPGPVVMLRVDMDALPITEETGATYASLTPGVMHACGHDAHMAIGLGVATLVARRRTSMSGVLKLIFQPAEETPGGAEAMVRDGVLDDPRPDLFLGVHVWNNLPLGTIAAPPGPMMAAEDGWTCLVQGKGGHGALPHQVVDPIVASAQMVTALQTVVSRNVDPLEAAVVSVGKIQGGNAFNVIPAEVELVGTIRTLAPQIRDTVVRRMREVLEGVAAACGVEIALKIESGTPAVINAAEVAEVVRASAGAVVGPENVLDAYRTMGSEDAAFLMQAIPGCYFFVGSANPERGLDATHHNPRFDIDEDALPLAVETLMGALGHYLL
jgi:amidohydrolase